jgi:hypothetical protein
VQRAGARYDRVAKDERGDADSARGERRSACAACGGLATRQILWASYCQETLLTGEHAAQAAGAFASFVCELAASPA